MLDSFFYCLYSDQRQTDKQPEVHRLRAEESWYKWSIFAAAWGDQAIRVSARDLCDHTESHQEE